MKPSKLIASSKISNKKPLQPKANSVRGLKQLQVLTAQAIMRPLTRGNKMQTRWVDGNPTRSVAAKFIKPNDRLTSFERLEIYNRQYWFRIIGCFYDDYPGLRAVVGDAKFERLALAYLTKHPSQSFTLRNLGSRLCQFLKAEPKWTEPRTALALDMAQLEWAYVLAFDEEERPVVQPEYLQGRMPYKIRLSLQPYITLLKLKHPVDDLLIKIKKSNSLRSEASNAVDIRAKTKRTQLIKSIRPQPTYLAVHRVNFDVYYKRLEPAGYRILKALREGETLHRACLNSVTRKTDATSEFAEQVQQWFQSWTSMGWLCSRSRRK